MNLKKCPPHHHDPTWAIYGQVSGQTEMTDWEPVQETSPGKVKKVKTYILNPGDVYFYPVDKIHSPKRQPGRLLRIEGQNLDKIGRSYLEPV